MAKLFPPTTETADRTNHGAVTYSDDPNRLKSVGFFDDPTYLRYMQMDKRFADARMTDDLLAVHDDLSESTCVEYLSVAGWASAEAALVAHNRPQEERLAYLDEASEAWDKAIHLQHVRNVRQGMEADSYNANSTRLQLAKVFIPLMRDMIGGDITKQTRKRLYDDMLFLAAINASALQDMQQQGRADEAGPHVGLAHELNAMLAVNRLQSPTLIAMPASAKAGNGLFHSEETRDIELLHLQWGDIMGVTTLESKARPKEKHYRRYTAAIVNGRIHLFKKDSNSPIDTVVLFLQEHDDMLRPSGKRELEKMTDTIVHLARHQLSDEPGVPHHCRDVERCEVVPHTRSGSFARRIGGLAVAS